MFGFKTPPVLKVCLYLLLLASVVLRSTVSPAPLEGVSNTVDISTPLGGMVLFTPPPPLCRGSPWYLGTWREQVGWQLFRSILYSIASKVSLSCVYCYWESPKYTYIPESFLDSWMLPFDLYWCSPPLIGCPNSLSLPPAWPLQHTAANTLSHKATRLTSACMQSIVHGANHQLWSCLRILTFFVTKNPI